ncbi:MULTISPECIES: LysR family transcriptional regulator [Rhizobium]|uniref:LysR family transcriptional regulator n=1 Tax=Rhizobium TaxID=379 RepID=UPI000A1FDD94|nr:MULTISPECIES: LysR family transcriptional regulator [Rhizobium]ARM90924.1 LysR family transcriptional regulator protein [Rhizobium sp. CIAT894]MBB4299511.1 DNA-binding transcriptional LysR family regulator [Rhizobium leguminosarum]MBB4310949.1 DNA-binding transcriptional LysR family regulator [Rhizobium leguminosarum]MBB4419939.1 DNA-binding transcriptional LysR family regulator [Rhizobium leguminosarum]MBB4435065.1 DNA-binding transcriptional LysR family regulator [Rhizobium esperanzae]
MNLDDVAVFVEVAEGNNLSSAAKRLGISTMTASRRLAALESELGARLVHRTTRSVSLTLEGEKFTSYARQMIEAQTSARDEFCTTSIAKGVLRITAPVVFGQSVVMPIIPKLLERHPQLGVDFTLSDDIVNIVALGIDLALRISPMRDSNLIARRLTDNPRMLCAAPSYLAKRGVPKTLDDLQEHNCLHLHLVQKWQFEKGGEIQAFRPRGTFATSSVAAVLDACVRGLGIALLSYWDIRSQLQLGSLVQLELNDAKAEQLAVWAVFPTNQHVPVRVREFLALLEPVLREDAAPYH